MGSRTGQGSSEPRQRRRGRRRLPHQLPAGRHGLPHNLVERNQRERILRAVIEVARRTGYADLTVAETISAAGLSRRTFYEQFDNKAEAFLAACDRMVERLVADVAESAGGGGTWSERIALGLSTFLERLTADPELAHVCIVETLTVGRAALSRHAAAKDALRELLEPAAREAPSGLPVPPLAAESAIGGVYEVVCARVLEGRTRELPLLLPDLLQLLLLPFVGVEEAAREADEARRRRDRLARSRSRPEEGAGAPDS